MVVVADAKTKSGAATNFSANHREYPTVDRNIYDIVTTAAGHDFKNGGITFVGSNNR